MNSEFEFTIPEFSAESGYPYCPGTGISYQWIKHQSDTIADCPFLANLQFDILLIFSYI